MFILISIILLSRARLNELKKGLLAALKLGDLLHAAASLENEHILFLFSRNLMHTVCWWNCWMVEGAGNWYRRLFQYGG